MYSVNKSLVFVFIIIFRLIDIENHVSDLKIIKVSLILKPSKRYSEFLNTYSRLKVFIR